MRIIDEQKSKMSSELKRVYAALRNSANPLATAFGMQKAHEIFHANVPQDVVAFLNRFQEETPFRAKEDEQLKILDAVIQEFE